MTQSIWNLGENIGRAYIGNNWYKYIVKAMDLIGSEMKTYEVIAVQVYIDHLGCRRFRAKELD